MRRSWRSRCSNANDARGRLLRFRTNVDDWVRLRGRASAAVRGSAGDGGLTPYLHVRADLWAKVTRALYYDLVDIGEERMVDGPADVRGCVWRRILRDGRCEAGEGRALNGPMLKTGAGRVRLGGVLRAQLRRG